MNNVSSTIAVNLGVFPDASEGMGEEDDEEAGIVSEEDEDDEDGSRKDRLTKPFDSANKHWNKPGSGDPDQISHLTEEIAKLEKKLAKSKRHSKKRARESPDNDSDDNLDIGSSSTGS